MARPPDGAPTSWRERSEANGMRKPYEPAALSEDATTTSPLPDFPELVERIRSEDADAMEELYRLFSHGIRCYLRRQLARQEVEDKIHDTFLIVVEAIRRGTLREPERLMGFVRTIVRRLVAASIEDAIQSRKDLEDLEQGFGISDSGMTPEEDLISRQQTAIMETILRSISSRDREILTRFYLREQSQEQICREMDLTETQFRLLKSRAKARFGELGRRRVSRRPLHRLFLRKAAGSPH